VTRQSLACIRCGACLNACPVYQQIGGHAYGSVYPGPIGAVITPQLIGIKKAAQLPYASSLCGACREVCPVKIDIPELLLHLRAQIADGTAITTEAPMKMHMARTRSRDRNSSAGSHSGRSWAKGLTRLATDFIPLSSSKMAKYTGTTMSKPRMSDLVRNLIAGFIGRLSQNCFGRNGCGVARQLLVKRRPDCQRRHRLRAVD